MSDSRRRSIESYMEKRIQETFTGLKQSNDKWPDVELDVLTNCEAVVKCVHAAYLNPSEYITMIFSESAPLIHNEIVKLSWDMEDYCRELTPRQNGQNITKEAILEKKFPPAFQKSPVTGLYPYETRPATVVDKSGKIALWYLPNVLTSKQQVSILDRQSYEMVVNITIVDHSDQHA